MAEKRWGSEWRPGMRVIVFNKYETPGQKRCGIIVDRSWGRDRGKPIWWFGVKMDNVDGLWAFGPGELRACPPDESEETD